MSVPIRAANYKVSGRVQGVGFRAATCHEAERLGLVGWVRNLPDGCVEAYACGVAVALAEFEAWLRHGPAFARVTHLDVEPAPSDPHARFEIR